MTATQLINYLTEFSAHELRIDFAREILARNMNFSPAWILALLKRNDEQNLNYFTISNLDSLLRMIGLDLPNPDVVTLFEYFDLKNQGKVSYQEFIQLLFPACNQALRNAAAKRIATDLQLSLDLKYALKRLFIQILQATIKMKDYGYFFPNTETKQSEQKISQEKIKQFLATFGKYPTQSQLSFVVSMLNSNRIKGISPKQAQQIIENSQKQLRQLENDLKEKQCVMPSTLISHEQMSPIRKIHFSKNQSPTKMKSPIKTFFNANERSPYKSEQIYETSQRKDVFQSIKRQKEEGKMSPSPLKILKTTSIIQPAYDYENQAQTSPNQPFSLKNSSFMNQKQKIIENKPKNFSQKVEFPIRESKFSTPQRKAVGFAQQLLNGSKFDRKNQSKYEPQTINTEKNQSDIGLLIKCNNMMQDQLQMIANRNAKRIQKIKENLGKFTYY